MSSEEAATIPKETVEEDEESLEYIETEPVLAYTRMKNDIIDILEKDSVSCIRSDHKVFTHRHLKENDNYFLCYENKISLDFSFWYTLGPNSYHGP